MQFDEFSVNGRKVRISKWRYGPVDLGSPPNNKTQYIFKVWGRLSFYFALQGPHLNPKIIVFLADSNKSQGVCIPQPLEIWTNRSRGNQIIHKLRLSPISGAFFQSVWEFLCVEAAQTNIGQNNPQERIGLALKPLETWTHIIRTPPVFIKRIESTLNQSCG